MTRTNKVIKDRLNELKSKLSEETNVKLTKRLNEMKIYSLSIRIDELEWLIEKIRRES